MWTGYVKTYRASMDHAVFDDEWLWKLFSWCVMRANYRDVPSPDGIIRRGSFTVGRIQASRELRTSDSRVYRGLKKLESLGSISLKSNNRFTTVTVCNYDSYQGDEPASRTTDEQPANNERTTDDRVSEQPANTIRRSKEIKKVRKKEAAAPLVVIPESLSVPEFAAAWADWQEHRREIKSPLTATQAAKQLKMLENIGLSRAIGMIEHTIEKGWRGLREPDGALVATPASRVPTQEDYDNWTPYGLDG